MQVDARPNANYKSWRKIAFHRLAKELTLWDSYEHPQLHLHLPNRVFPGIGEIFTPSIVLLQVRKAVVLAAGVQASLPRSVGLENPVTG
jgi:hypothetical protein